MQRRDLYARSCTKFVGLSAFILKGICFPVAEESRLLPEASLEVECVRLFSFLSLPASQLAPAVMSAGGVRRQPGRGRSRFPPSKGRQMVTTRRHASLLPKGCEERPVLGMCLCLSPNRLGNGEGTGEGAAEGSSPLSREAGDNFIIKSPAAAGWWGRPACA